MTNFHLDISFEPGQANFELVQEKSNAYQAHFGGKTIISSDFFSSKILSTREHSPSTLNNSCLIIDPANQKITCMRDYPGSDPLYYYLTKKRLIVSNNFRVFKDKKIKLTINHNKRLEYFTRYFNNPRDTLYQEVYKILPGEIWQFENGQFNLASQHNPHHNQSLEFEKALIEALKPNLNYDYSLAWELSGGIDSSLLLSQY